MGSPPDAAAPSLEAEVEAEARRASARRRWRWAALGIFLLALGTRFYPLIGHDPRRVIVANAADGRAASNAWDPLVLNDLRFGVALTARNAYTLTHRPHRILDLEQCYPTRNALALGEPMITPGVLGMPAALLFGDPLVTFSSALLLMTLLGAFAVYWLVEDWTRSPPAAIVAGLLYGFHAIKLGDVVHFFVWDMAWTALALLLARRLLEQRRWHQAVGLGLCCALQVLGSFYPLLAAVVLAVPIGAVLLLQAALRTGVRKVPWAQLALVVVATGAVAAFLFTPYLEFRSQGTLQVRPFQAFFAYAWLLPGERFSPGWVLPALLLVGIAFGGRRLGPIGGLRWALLVGGGLCMLMASGGSAGDALRGMARGEPTSMPHLPNPWTPIASLLPGLDVIRAPAALFAGVHLAAAILAGAGAAALLRAVPQRWRHGAAAALIAITFVDVLRPSILGLEPSVDYQPVELRPSEATLAFFEELEAKDNRGPIFEAVAEGTPVAGKVHASRSLLLLAYHHRRTSTCFNSFLGRREQEIRALNRRLDEGPALDRLRELGFTTLVVRERLGLRGANRRANALIERIDRRPSLPLREILRHGGLRAYALLPKSDEHAASADPRARNGPSDPGGRMSRRPRPEPEPTS